MPKKTSQGDPGTLKVRHRSPRAFAGLSQQILLQAGTGGTRPEFLRKVTRMILEFLGCDAMELWLKDKDGCYRCSAALAPSTLSSGASSPDAGATPPSRAGAGAIPAFRFETLPHLEMDANCRVKLPQGATILEQLCADIAAGELLPPPASTIAKGTFWIADTAQPVTFNRRSGQDETLREVVIGGDCSSLAIIPLERAEGSEGLMLLKSRQPGFFNESVIHPFEQLAMNLTLSLVHQKTQSALSERVKELTCLYEITQVSDQPGLQLDEVLQRIVELLPPSWQYPSIASARITLDGKPYQSAGFKEGPQKQSAEIVVRSETRGLVEVVYSEEKPELDEGPFLKEERGLLDAVASHISLVVERRRAEDEKTRLQEQLRHADRLATIGELAAGVAHELNEPLGNMLGFAQLAAKSVGLPEQPRQDIEKIVSACLHAREVIQRLMMFARQTPPKKTVVNLNQIVQDGLYFLERRCGRQGIEVIRILEPSLPEIKADAAQLHQVLTNLTVNALQAMPRGGKLTLRTARREDTISLVVEDTGTGMDEKVLKKIFMPFFTTKDVGQGLGLGLAVVHGIVTGHRGSIKVQSRPGEGSRFEVILPISSPPEQEEDS
jgi:signal transduction histidine kinase